MRRQVQRGQQLAQGQEASEPGPLPFSTHTCFLNPLFTTLFDLLCVRACARKDTASQAGFCFKTLRDAMGHG